MSAAGLAAASADSDGRPTGHGTTGMWTTGSAVATITGTAISPSSECAFWTQIPTVKTPPPDPLGHGPAARSRFDFRLSCGIAPLVEFFAPREVLFHRAWNWFLLTGRQECISVMPGESLIRGVEESRRGWGKERDMPDSMFGSLLNMLDKQSVGDVAHALGQPEQSVARGMESSVAAMLGGLASKSEDSGALRKILDIVPSTSGAVSWSQIASGVADPNSSLMAMGKRLLPALFGSGEQAVTSGISGQSGLSSGAISTLLSMAAPVVMSFISKRVRDGGMTMGGLGTALQRESATIKSALPAGLSELFWPRTETVAAAASPVVAQAVQKGTSFNWLPVLAIAGLGLGLLWFLGHARRPSIVVPSVAVGRANRFAVPIPKTVCTVPANVNLPEGGAAARLLAFVQNPDAPPLATTWFNMDQMSFDTGSARLRPASQGQLDNIAVVLKGCPTVHLDIAAYTDNVGPAEANLRLSQNRAKAVVAELVSKGVSPERLAAKGYGEEDAIADNSTEQGRAQNRRAALRVTLK